MACGAFCGSKQMQDLFFGESNQAMFKAAAAGRREAGCQWCFEHVQMFVVGKSLVWICDNCKGMCDACEKCTQPVRQALIRKDNFKTCSMCFHKNWKKMEKEKTDHVQAQRPLTLLEKDLEKVSEFRTLAAKGGLLRPFLFLVSLPPVGRLQIAINLGWTFVGSALFGDSHAETWEILNKKDVGLRDRMSRMRDSLFRREVNWHSILLPLCEELCVPAYMNWSEEFVSPKMTYAEALTECHKAQSSTLNALEIEFVDKIGKHQRARFSSLQACSLAELKNSEPMRKLLAMPQLQGQATQPLLSYAIDSSFLILARRDGSDGTGQVEAEDLVQEVVAFFAGVCEGESEVFEDVVGLARKKMGRDGVAHERDSAPPGSILNANISGFWLTMDLLDIDNSTPAVCTHSYLSICAPTHTYLHALAYFPCSNALARVSSQKCEDVGLRDFVVAFVYRLSATH